MINSHFKGSCFKQLPFCFFEIPLLSVNRLDEMLTIFVDIRLALLLHGIAIKRFKQPNFAAYVTAGIAINRICLKPVAGTLNQFFRTNKNPS